MNTHSRQQRLFRRTGAGLPIAVATLFAIGSLPASSGVDATAEGSARSNVRLLTTNATLTGGMLQGLVAGFEEQTGHTVTITTGGPDLFDQARAGEADIVMAHLGFTELHDFVSEGLGGWPTTVFSNSVAFLIPPDDPAGIADLDDPFAAFEAIAEHQAPFVVNNLGETLYITDTLWNAAGQPDKGDWFIDPGLRGAPAVREASERGAYTIWGLHPFLMMRQQFDLEAVVYNDSLMQRILATVVVQRTAGKVNKKGALALQDYLADPATQATIRAFDLPPIDNHREITGPVFWPAGNQNDNEGR